MVKYSYIFLSVLLLFSACTIDTKPEATVPNTFEQAPSEVIYNPPTKSELFLYAVRPDTFNPLLTEFSANRDMLSLIYEPLINVTQDYNLSFRLAENFTISDNGRKCTLILRQNVRWHDGSMFSTADVDYTFNQIIKSGDACTYYQNLRNVKAAKSINSYTYEIELNAPDSGFIYLLNFPIIKNSSSDILQTKDNFNVVGTGMYTFGEYISLKSIALFANNAWWGNAPSIPTIAVSLLPDSTFSFNGFKMNNMNAVIVPYEVSGKYSVSENIHSVLANTNTYSYISVNHSNPLLQSPTLRKIIKEIVSTSKITQDLIPEFSTLCSSPVNPASQYSVPRETAAVDLKEYLTKEGYVQNNRGIRTKSVDGSNYLLEFDLLINKDNPTRVITGEYIANALSMYGITLNLIQKNEEDYLRLAQSNTYDLVLCETNISLNNNFSFILATDGELNFGRYSSPEMDEVLSQINSANDLSARTGYLQKFQTLFYDTMPHIPLYFLNKKILFDSYDLKDVTAGAIGNEYSNLNTWNTISGKEN